MKYLIYGDDLTRLSLKTTQLLEKLKKDRKYTYTFFDVEKGNYETWLAINNPSLFSESKIVRLTHLFTGRKSKLKERIKKFLKESKNNIDYVVVETKLLSRPPGYFDYVYKFKQEIYLFSLLDRLGEKKFLTLPQIIEKMKEPYEYLLFMIIRRLEDLVEWLTSERIARGYYQEKLKSQAGNWRLDELQRLISALLLFDLEYKMGKSYHRQPKLALGLFLFTYQEVKNAS